MAAQATECPLPHDEEGLKVHPICEECRHCTCDCICWYLAELAKGERDEG